MANIGTASARDMSCLYTKTDCGAALGLAADRSSGAAGGLLPAVLSGGAPVVGVVCPCGC
jgi:hypothetical protein